MGSNIQKRLCSEFFEDGAVNRWVKYESFTSNDVSNAVEMRSELCGNGVGDRPDRGIADSGEQIDGSAARSECNEENVGLCE